MIADSFSWKIRSAATRDHRPIAIQKNSLRRMWRKSAYDGRFGHKNGNSGIFQNEGLTFGGIAVIQWNPRASSFQDSKDRNGHLD
jgi:hypothetical protein